MTEFIVTGTGGSRVGSQTERVQIMAGIQGAAGRDGQVFRWMGAWDAVTTYTADDAVYDANTGAAFLCTGTNLNADPDSNPEVWDVLADPRVGVANHEALDDPHPQYNVQNGFDDTLNIGLDARANTTITFDPSGGSANLDSGSDDDGGDGLQAADWDDNFAFDVIRIGEGDTITITGD